MSFPKWAPSILIETYKQLEAKADYYRNNASREYECFFPVDEWEQEFKASNNEEKIDQLETLIPVLYRLLSNPDMKSVWPALSRPPAVPKPWKNDPAFFLWASIPRALTDFPVLMANAQTRSEMRKSLLTIASKAKALQDAIAANAIAKAHANELVPVYLTIRNLKDRQDQGETPFDSEFDMPLTLSVDCLEAWDKREVKDNYLSGYDWHDTPLLCRLTYWAKEAKETKLNALLQLFIETLEAQADFSPEIKQPGRSADAIKPFLIRRISRYLIYYYGQPLHDIAAQIVSVVLDLQSPMTRDDIRPYIITGKKMT